MYPLFQFVILLLLVADLIMLWSGRILMLIRLSAVQGVLLAALLLLPVDGKLNAELVFLSLAVFCLKGAGFPVFLRHVCRKLGLEPVVRPRLGRMYPLAAGLAGLAFSLWLEGRIPAVTDLFPPLLFPVALTTLFCGLILVVGCAKALAQVTGYLVVENGKAHALEGEHRRGEKDVLGVERAVHGHEQQRGEQHALHGGEAYEHEYAARPEHDEVGDEQQKNDEGKERGHRLTAPESE